MYHNSYICERSCAHKHTTRPTANRLTIPDAWLLSHSLSDSVTHSPRALAIIRACVYILIVVSTQFHLCTNHLCITPSFPSNSTFSRLPHYSHVPQSSICPSLNQINCFLLLNRSIVSAGLQCFSPCKYFKTSTRSFRRTEFLLTILLLLGGDVNLNPGPVSSHPLKFSHLNIRSASSVTPDLNKPAVLQEINFIRSQSIDIVTLSETWLSSDTPSATLNSLTPANYSLLHSPRPDRIGGGLACVYRSTLKISQLPTTGFSSFECQCLRVTLPSSSLTILNIYCPPSASKTTFLSEFCTLLESLISLPSELLITGDFNFHVDSPIPTSDAPFLALLDCFSLKQHVSFPTHESNHTLDLLITRSCSTFMISVNFTDPGLSDHLAVLCALSVPSNTRQPRITKTVRPFHVINSTLFSNDVLSSELYTSPDNTMEDYLSQFDSTLTKLLDKHAPVKVISCSSRLPKPFITTEILKEKSKRSKLESICRKTRSLTRKTSKRNPDLLPNLLPLLIELTLNQPLPTV